MIPLFLGGYAITPKPFGGPSPINGYVTLLPPPPQDSPGSCHCFGQYTTSSDRPATNVVRLADKLV